MTCARSSRPRSVAITGLVVGRLGLLERLGIGAPESRGRTSGGDVVPWSAVVRADRRGIVVRDDAERSIRGRGAPSHRGGRRPAAHAGRRDRGGRGLVPAARRRADRERAALPPAGSTPGFLAVMSAVDKERGLACVKQYAAGADGDLVRGRALRARRDEGRDRGEPARPAPHRRGERGRGEAPGEARRADARRDRLRLPGTHAGRVHPRGAAGDRGGRRLLPEREEPEGVLQGGRRRGGREPPRRGRLRRGRHDHDLARPGAARRVAAAGCARLRGRSEPSEGARARQHRARARGVRLLRLARATRSSSRAT